MDNLATKIYKIKILIEKKAFIQNQIMMLENELLSITRVIEQTCPHCDITHFRSYTGHRPDYWYECNICKQQVDYNVYGQYLNKYNKTDVIIDSKW